MSYKIRADYRTGDSFRSEDISTVLEMVWEDKEVAKCALKRIKDHYAWYADQEWHSHYSKEMVREPEWHRGLDTCTLKVLLDNGSEVQFHAPWCGYFDHLYGARVFTPEDPDLSFTVS